VTLSAYARELPGSDAEAMELPSQTDAVARGISQAIGGPAGHHVTRNSRRYWMVVRIIIALTCVTLTLHWMEKSSCSNGEWQKLSEYRHACYTDVVALYASEGLNTGQVPYKDHAVEYPVLTGAFMGLIGLPVHAYVESHPATNPYTLFYNVNALVLSALAVAAVGVLLTLRRRRPWDAAMFAVSPALFLTATVNWDLLAVAFAVFAILAWARGKPTAAAILIGLGTSAKLWPVFLLLPIVLLGWRSRRMSDAVYTVAVAALAWVAVNLPIALLYPASWWTFFKMNSVRGVDWGTLWYIGAHVPTRNGYGIEPFLWLNGHIGVVNLLSYLLFGLACVGLAVLTVKAPQRPRLAQIAFLTVAAFLIFSKVWSQQYVLWLLPLAILARPRWGAFLAWQFAEVLYFFGFDGELMGASGNRIFPEGLFVLAATLRLVTLLILCGYVIRDMWRSERDVVRQVYEDDPDGGLFNDAPDRWVGTETALADFPLAGADRAL
jgi:uncharacterized membrane protein